jgi:hypothetical protein
MGPPHINRVPPRWQQFVLVADRDVLEEALSDHTLFELGALLSGCGSADVRGQIVAEVLKAAPEFGDRAVIVALARVAHTNKPDGGAEPETPR